MVYVHTPSSFLMHTHYSQSTAAIDLTSIHWAIWHKNSINYQVNVQSENYIDVGILHHCKLHIPALQIIAQNQKTVEVAWSVLFPWFFMGVVCNPYIYVIFTLKIILHTIQLELWKIVHPPFL